MNKAEAKLRLEEATFPRGDKYIRIFAGDLHVGNYAIVDGGFLPFGCRKISPNERVAQIRVIQRFISHHIGLAAKAAQLYEEL